MAVARHACSGAKLIGANKIMKQTALAIAPPPKDVLATISVRPAADALATLRDVGLVDAVILDPWYNRGVGGTRDDYHEWLGDVIDAAAHVAPHVFVWGFPEILAFQLSNLPKQVRLLAWLTWYYKNCPSVIRGWRSAQNTCLHLAREDATVYPQHFLTDDQRRRLDTGKMRFIPGPPSVLEAPLNIGFVGRDEQTGHPAQKPLSVIEPLVLMSTVEGGTVVDPMCGSGTTGMACARLNRNAVLCDASPQYITLTKERLLRHGHNLDGG